MQFKRYIIGKTNIPTQGKFEFAEVIDVYRKRGQNSLFYMIGMDSYDSLKRLDELGMIHLGMRNFRGDQFELLPYCRFNGNYLIFSKEWNEDKYRQFLEFEPKPEIVYPESEYLRINEVSDEEAADRLLKFEKALDSGLLGIDFETAGSEVPGSDLEGFPEYSNFLPLGLSITDKRHGMYFDFDDWRETKITRPLFFKALEGVIDRNKQRLMAFNVSFEMRCLFDMYGRFFELGDARAWCIVDNRKENLKFLSQYYLGTRSWDYENDFQIKALEELFSKGDYQTAESVFLEYEKQSDKTSVAARGLFEQMSETRRFPYDRKKWFFIKKLFDLNLGNPQFLPRLKKYWNNTWASVNQKVLGRYCVIDAVMDIYITDAVRSIELNGKKYTEDSYYVYLYNQYLGAHISTSGITVDLDCLERMTKYYETLYFNTMICVSQFMTYTRRELLETDKDYIPVELTDKLKVVVSDCRSFFFLERDKIKLGKAFLVFLREYPEAFEKIITRYGAELSYVYEIAKAAHDEDISPDLEAKYKDEALLKKMDPQELALKRPGLLSFNKFLRKRNVFVEIADMVEEDLELPEFYEKYNEAYLKKTNLNARLLLKYWNKTEEELIDAIQMGLLPAMVPKNIVPELEKYIWDKKKLSGVTAAALSKSLSKHLYDSYVEKYEKIADRKITDPIDHSLDKLIIYDFNKPMVRDELALDLQRLYEYPVTIAGWYFSLKNSKDDLGTFTRVEYEKFKAKVESKCKGDYMSLPKLRQRFYKLVEVKGDYGRVLSVHEERKKWTAGGNDSYGGSTTWDGLKAYLYKDKPFVPDLTFRHITDDPVDCFCKFFGYMEMNLGAEKTLTTTLRPIRKNSGNYVDVDGTHILWKKGCQDPEQPQMYRIDVHVNSVHTGRWASNFHTMPPEDDGRLALKFKKGYIGSYFDISQAEPRSICYLSRDPDFMELYDSGKDAYLELAKLAFPQHMNDKALVKLHRKQCKGIILSGLYGRGIKGLAKALGFSVDDANQVWSSFISKMKVVARFKDELLDFAQKNGRVETILGNRIPVDPERVHTSSMNYVIQGFTAIILAAGFYNSVAEAISRGINVSVKGVVHDSSTCEFPIEKLLHMDLHYRKFFREWIRYWWNPDYKYDLDLLMDYRHHCPYNFNIETGDINVSMWTGYADEFLEYLSQGYSFKVEERKNIVQTDYKGGARNDLAGVERTHNYMDDDYSRCISRTELRLKLQEPLKDIGWYYEPVSSYPKWGSRTLSPAAVRF